MSIEEFERAVSMKSYITECDDILETIEEQRKAIFSNKTEFVNIYVGDTELNLRQEFGTMALSVVSREVERQRGLFQTEFNTLININSPIA